MERLLKLTEDYPVLFMGGQFYIGNRILNTAEPLPQLCLLSEGCSIAFDEQETISKMFLSFFEKHKQHLYGRKIHISEEVDNAFLTLLGLDCPDEGIERKIALDTFLLHLDEIIADLLGETALVIGSNIFRLVMHQGGLPCVSNTKTQQRLGLEYNRGLKDALSEIESRTIQFFKSRPLNDSLSQLFEDGYQGRTTSDIGWLGIMGLKRASDYYLYAKVRPHIMKKDGSLYCFEATFGGVKIPVIGDKVSFAGYSPLFYIIGKGVYNHPAIKKDNSANSFKETCLPYYETVKNLNELRKFLEISLDDFCEGYSQTAYANQTLQEGDRVIAPWRRLTPENFPKECSPEYVAEFCTKHPDIQPFEV